MGIRQNKDKVYRGGVHKTDKRLYPEDDSWMSEYEDWLDGFEHDIDEHERELMDKFLEEESEKEEALSSNGEWLVYGKLWKSLPAIHEYFFQGISMTYNTFKSKVYRSGLTDLSGMITEIVEDEQYWEKDDVDN